MYGNVEWDFRATSHDNRYGLGGTWKQRVHEKTLAWTIDPQNSTGFAKYATVCLGISK